MVMRNAFPGNLRIHMNDDGSALEVCVYLNYNDPGGHSVVKSIPWILLEDSRAPLVHHAAMIASYFLDDAG